jgi:hypothetical protein
MGKIFGFRCSRFGEQTAAVKQAGIRVAAGQPVAAAGEIPAARTLFGACAKYFIRSQTGTMTDQIGLSGPSKTEKAVTKIEFLNPIEFLVDTDSDQISPTRRSSCEANDCFRSQPNDWHQRSLVGSHTVIAQFDEAFFGFSSIRTATPASSKVTTP